MWPNFTIVKYNSKISIIYHQIKISKRYNEQVFNKKAVLKNFAIFTEKHLRWSLFLNKNAGLQSSNFTKKRLQHRFFTENIEKFLRTSVLENICERLFERFPTWASNIKSNMGIEEDIFSKTKYGNWRRHFLKNKKNHSKFSKLKKTYLFMMLLIAFLDISTVCRRRRLPYIIKDDRNEGL